MILGIDLFGREAISPNEKKMLKSANKTASSLFARRFSPDLYDQWGVDPKQLTLDQVEKTVVKLIIEKNGIEKRYGAKTVC